MTNIGILGAGIAGLSCAWLLNQEGFENITVFEKRPYAGGLARSFDWHGFECDFAAHRLFTRNEETLQSLLQLVPMGRHIRRSQIYFNGHWMKDPLDALQLITHASPKIGFNIAKTYFTRPKQLEEDSFSSFVIHKYGTGLYDFFFRPYTEKLFGISGENISASWGRTKVRLASPFDKFRQSTKTKFNYFYYPLRGGYGAIPDTMYQSLKDKILLNTTVTGLETTSSQITNVLYEQNSETKSLPVDILISTLPLTISGRLLNIDVPLTYRKVDAVYLLLNKPFASDNHWIYFMDGDVSINRMIEFKNMSPIGKPEDCTVLCAEVTEDHTDVVEKVISDLNRIGFCQRSEIIDTLVIREDYSYPVYSKDYESIVDSIQTKFAEKNNFYVVGRAAEFKHREVDDNYDAALECVNNIMTKVKQPLSYTNSLLPKDEKKAKSVWAVVLAYNNIEDTIECIESVQKTTYANLEIILVDNGSTDETVSIIRAKFPNVHLIENGENLWVPAGYNVGFKYALENQADYILLLNNDTTIPENMVESLLLHAENDPHVGIVMPKVAYYDNPDDTWASGARYRKFPPAVIMQTGNDRVQEQAGFLEYAPSCGLLITRDAFTKAGLFDPGYLFLNDDWDFCERVRTHGLKIKYAPEIKMLHKVSRTTKGPQSPLFWRVFGESNVRYYRRHGRPAWASVPIHVGYIFMREFIIKGNWKFLNHFIDGVKTGMTKPLGQIPQVEFHAEKV